MLAWQLRSGHVRGKSLLSLAVPPRFLPRLPDKGWPRLPSSPRGEAPLQLHVLWVSPKATGGF